MEKWQFKQLVSGILSRATNNKLDKTEGEDHPNLGRISGTISTKVGVDNVRKYDPVLADKLMNVEKAGQDLDDYILARFEQNKG